jgi:hypothetical protein
MSDSNKPPFTPEQKQATSEALKASGVRFHLSQEEILRVVGGDIEFDKDGLPTVNGVPLAVSLKILGHKHPEIVDSSPKSSQHEDEVAKPPIRVWSELRTVKDKVRYIRDHGLDKFSALLQNRPRLDPLKTPAK